MHVVAVPVRIFVPEKRNLNSIVIIKLFEFYVNVKFLFVKRTSHFNGVPSIFSLLSAILNLCDGKT